MSSFYQAEVVDYLAADDTNHTTNYVATVARKILGLNGIIFVSEQEYIKFRAYFGCNFDTAVALWVLLTRHAEIGKAKVEHMFWALLFMKNYGIECVLCGLVGHPDPKTFRKWTKFMIEQMSTLQEFLVSYITILRDLFAC